jgi:hypothetical protein
LGERPPRQPILAEKGNRTVTSVKKETVKGRNGDTAKAQYVSNSRFADWRAWPQQCLARSDKKRKRAKFAEK